MKNNRTNHTNFQLEILAVRAKSKNKTSPSQKKINGVRTNLFATQKDLPKNYLNFKSVKNLRWVLDPEIGGPKLVSRPKLVETRFWQFWAPARL